MTDVAGIMADMKHNHTCHCGIATETPHQTGTKGCPRFLTEAPMPAPRDEELRCEMWWVDDDYQHRGPVTDTTLKRQRGYKQHPCGCWSRSPGSTISLPDET